MNDFPDFMKSPANRIGEGSQYTDDIEGYVFNGADGSQMAFWTCYQDRDSREHTHDFDEYFVVVQGQYTLIIGEEAKRIEVGQECFIPKANLIPAELFGGLFFVIRVLSIQYPVPSQASHFFIADFSYWLLSTWYWVLPFKFPQ